MLPGSAVCLWLGCPSPCPQDDHTGTRAAGPPSMLANHETSPCMYTTSRFLHRRCHCFLQSRDLQIYWKDFSQHFILSYFKFGSSPSNSIFPGVWMLICLFITWFYRHLVHCEMWNSWVSVPRRMICIMAENVMPTAVSSSNVLEWTKLQKWTLPYTIVQSGANITRFYEPTIEVLSAFVAGAHLWYDLLIICLKVWIMSP